MLEHSIFPGLPIERDHAAGPSRAPRVCVATYEIVGPSRSGGIGTAYFSLASALAAAGHNVTILYLLRNHCEQGSIDIWRSYYRQRGIRFVPLPRSRKPANAPTNMATAYDAYRWLKARDFDVIHFSPFCDSIPRNLASGNEFNRRVNSAVTQRRPPRLPLTETREEAPPESSCAPGSRTRSSGDRLRSV